jgi:hypothetical protein
LLSWSTNKIKYFLTQVYVSSFLFLLVQTFTMRPVLVSTSDREERWRISSRGL